MHYRDCVTIIKEYVTSTGDLMALWSFVRIAYAAFLDMPDKKKLERVSKAGDVKGCLEEVRYRPCRHVYFPWVICMGWLQVGVEC